MVRLTNNSSGASRAEVRGAAGTRRIMLVDDAAVIREPVSMALRCRGHHVTCASNGREAMDMLPTARPDLIVLDGSMPIMNGLTFLRTLRADTDLCGVPVVMFTSNDNPEDVAEAYRLGVKDYLFKTEVTLSELFSRLERCLVEVEE